MFDPLIAVDCLPIHVRLSFSDEPMEKEVGYFTTLQTVTTPRFVYLALAGGPIFSAHNLLQQNKLSLDCLVD